MTSFLKERLLEPLAGAVSNPVTLRFADQTTERAYQEDYFVKSLAQVRLALILGSFLYAVFGFLDGQLIPEAKLVAWLIRYALVCPLLIGVFLFSYSRYFRAFMDLCIAVAGFISGCGILAMVGLSSPPGNYLYYAGLLLTVTFFFTFLKLRFVTATILAWLIFALYEVIGFWINRTPSAILINNTFFFVAFNITGMLANYSLESYMRSDFLQRGIIHQQTEHLRETLHEVDQRRRKAEDISQLDPLTNLFNRRHFFSLVELECNKDRCFLRDLSVMILDLDYFKMVNDTYGHVVGDQVLLNIARIIKNSVRYGDVACRYGGEEFAILLPKTSLDTAITVGQRLRENVAKSPIQTDKSLIRMTVSIGVASLSENNPTDFDTLIERADTALYSAKKAGRNQVRSSIRENDSPISGS